LKELKKRIRLITFVVKILVNSNTHSFEIIFVYNSNKIKLTSYYVAKTGQISLKRLLVKDLKIINYDAQQIIRYPVSTG